MDKLLITGSSGMVGRNIVENVDSSEFELLTPSKSELNLLDFNAVCEYIKSTKPDFVVHCAGLVGGIAANMARPVEFLSQNAVMGLNLINACLKHEIPHFLNLASSCMYPKNAQNPLREDTLLTGALEPTNEGYALAKLLCVRLCEYISREKGLFYKTLIPCNLYGKYDKFGANAHMIPAVIARIHAAKVSGQKQLEIWGDGSARREFMYAGDLASFVFFALKNFAKLPQNLNVGLNKDHTINEYYAIIAKVCGFEGNFTHDLSKPVGMAQKLIDSSNLNALGFKFTTSLENGISQTYEYYLTNGGGGGRPL